MKLFIPEIGTELILTKEWSFKLILEHRNNSIIGKYYPNHVIEYSYYSRHLIDLGFSGKVLRSKILQNKINELYNNNKTETYSDDLLDIWNTNKSEWIAQENINNIIFPIGTILKVDRIYIRKGKGMSDYSSITFYALFPGEKKKLRFFSHLSDVNNIECTIK